MPLAAFADVKIHLFTAIIIYSFQGYHTKQRSGPDEKYCVN